VTGALDKPRGHASVALFPSSNLVMIQRTSGGARAATGARITKTHFPLEAVKREAEEDHPTSTSA
jgi:hypothetical protein